MSFQEVTRTRVELGCGIPYNALMHKLFCYVDETGQDTVAQPGKKLAVFVVGVVLLDANQLHLEDVCVGYERQSGKGITPWHKAKYAFRLAYLRAVVTDKRFTGTLYYQVFGQPTKTFFDTYTLQAIANTIGSDKFNDVTCIKEIYVDGLTRAKQSAYAVELRRMGGQRASFHRATDQRSPLIRLADALAGLAREVEEYRTSDAARLLTQGKSAGVIGEV